MPQSNWERFQTRTNFLLKRLKQVEVCLEKNNHAELKYSVFSLKIVGTITND